MKKGFVIKHYTGHTHYRSIHETDSNCGTCDGAKCDMCAEQYDVMNEEWDELKTNLNLEEATLVKEAYEK